ncbi:MAG: sodium:proton antiporter NhaD, partial [Xanthomonadales bacterium]|nr:sodium:proton antiporter NhaD [Xanthomonadales bacterium]
MPRHRIPPRPLLMLPVLGLLLALPGMLLAAEGKVSAGAVLGQGWAGYTAIGLFAGAYLLVILEEFTHMRKSKPVMLAAGVIWAILAWVMGQSGNTHAAEEAVRHYLIEFAELFLFLLAAMTYVNAMSERQIFEALRAWLVSRGFGYRQLFWITGGLAFVLSPIIDNLTTALVMCAVLLAVGKDNIKFVAIGCVNVVVAANAGGAFSPFGDITTLMVWQKGVVHIYDFFRLFPPSLVSWVLPAAIMSFTVPNRVPEATGEDVMMKRGALRIVGLFILTIITAVVFHSAFHLPPVMGMLAGMAYLGFFGHYLKRSYKTEYIANKYQMSEDEVKANQEMGSFMPFDVYGHLARSEWDTLIFFYGVVMCVGALSLMGYLDVMSRLMYLHLGATTANTGVGILSSVIDNIPVMFAVL